MALTFFTGETRMYRSRVIVIAFAIECTLAGMIYAQPKDQADNGKARYVLDKMLDSRKKMKNLQFEVEFTYWEDSDFAKEQYNKLLSSSKGQRRTHIESLKWDILKGGNETSYQIDNIVLDWTGREKREVKQHGIVNSSGKKIPGHTKVEIAAWNGQTGVDYRHGGQIKYPGYAHVTNTPPSLVRRVHQPWRSHNGLLADQIAKALEAQKPINVETLPDGKYRVSFIDSLTNETIAIIDPEKGFSCTKQTWSRNSINNGYQAAEYEDLVDGVWLPVTAEIVSKSREGAVIRKTIVKMKKIKVNDPHFHEGLFHVDLPKGTQVTDNVRGIHYIVGGSKSVKLKDPR